MFIKMQQHIPSDHMCYIIKSIKTNKIYIGYTINFERRLRQHNGELVGGAKKTSLSRPWTPVCIIKGFYEKSEALRFEYRLQHPRTKKKYSEPAIRYIVTELNKLIYDGDGKKGAKKSWPRMNILWYYDYKIIHDRVINSTI